jgi:methyl-accepting chemotaxis protein
MAKAAAPIPKLESLARSISETAAENVSATRTIRMQVQESLKRTKRLGERSQELTRIVFDLEELADRVNILALNTSLRSNGGSGTETSLVHGEVEQMASRTSKLTRQIRQMAQSVSTETREASSSMESMIRDVILSTSLAEKTLNSSNELADELEEAGRQLVTLSDSINSQSKAAEELCRSVTEVAKTSELVRSGSRSTIDAIRSASQAIVDLQRSLAIFKLQADAVTVEPKELGNNKFVN